MIILKSVPEREKEREREMGGWGEKGRATHKVGFFGLQQVWQSTQCREHVPMVKIGSPVVCSI